VSCSSDGGDGSTPPERFESDRVYLICGNDEGAPNELKGCSIGLDGTFADFGNSVRPLTQPVLSPDRTRIAFAEPGGLIVLRRADGSAAQTLLMNQLSGPLDWSPQGSELLVSDRSALVVVDLDSSEERSGPVLDRFDLPEGQDVLGIARFSPDGTLLAVAVRERNADRDIFGVAVINRADGSVDFHGELSVARGGVQFSGTFADPAFDPKGRFLAWADGISGELSVLELDTDEVRSVKVAEPPELITGVSWSPSGLVAVGVAASLLLVNPAEEMSLSTPLPAEWSITAASPAWSADGTRFVTTVQHPRTDALLDLVEVDLSEGSVRLLTNSSIPPPPVSTFPGFPVWP
jgi:Tol biopolymer transport system component